MGSLQLSEFRDELTIQLGGRNDSIGGDPDRLNRWINAAYRYLSQPAVMEHPQLEGQLTDTLVLNQSDYTLDSTLFYSIRSVSVDDGVNSPYRLYETSLREYRNFLESFSTSARPIQYTLRRNAATASTNRLISLLPAPDATYAGGTLYLDVWLRPSALSLDTDVTVLPDDWDWILVRGACYFGFMSLGDALRAEFAKEDFDVLINNQVNVRRMEARDRTEALITVEVEDYEES